MGFWTKRKTVGEGDRAPDFTLPDLDGNAVSLRDALAGGPVVLAFFKITCPVCKLTFPFLERLHQAAPGQLRIFGISQDKPAATRGFNGEAGVTFPTLIDGPEYPVSNGYGLTNVPTLVVVERDGRISKIVNGFVKRDIEALGERTGAPVFRQGEYVPEWKAG